MARQKLDLEDLVRVAADVAAETGKEKLAAFLNVLAGHLNMFDDQEVTALLTGGRDYACDFYSIPAARRRYVGKLLNVASSGVESADLRAAVLDVAYDHVNENVDFGDDTLIESWKDEPTMFNVLAWIQLELEDE